MSRGRFERKEAKKSFLPRGWLVLGSFSARREAYRLLDSLRAKKKKRDRDLKALFYSKKAFELERRFAFVSLKDTLIRRFEI